LIAPTVSRSHLRIKYVRFSVSIYVLDMETNDYIFFRAIEPNLLSFCNTLKIFIRWDGYTKYFIENFEHLMLLNLRKFNRFKFNMRPEINTKSKISLILVLEMRRDAKTQLWAEKTFHKFSDYSLHERKCFMNLTFP
jgi:hypothetical protein